MAKNAGRRGGVKSKLVEPYVQVRLGLMFVIVNLLFSVMIFSVMGWYVYDVFTALTTYFKLSGQESAFAIDKLQVPLAIVTVLVVGFVVTTFYVAVHYTHQIYGPMVNINRFLDEMLEGKQPSALKLRDGDQLQELASKLNQLAERKKI